MPLKLQDYSKVKQYLGRLFFYIQYYTHSYASASNNFVIYSLHLFSWNIPYIFLCKHFMEIFGGSEQKKKNI